MPSPNPLVLGRAISRLRSAQRQAKELRHDYSTSRTGVVPADKRRSLYHFVALGSVMWGNEPDTWRYGKPRLLWPLVPYLVALAVGLVLFVAGGWMMAELSKAGPYDFGPAYRYTVEYSLFGAL